MHRVQLRSLPTGVQQRISLAAVARAKRVRVTGALFGTNVVNDL